jgi:hypothetical protein
MGKRGERIGDYKLFLKVEPSTACSTKIVLMGSLPLNKHLSGTWG